MRAVGRVAGRDQNTVGLRPEAGLCPPYESRSATGVDLGRLLERSLLAELDQESANNAFDLDLLAHPLFA
jgi:hypothetical protein